jgi:protein-tyrosine phosphatase
VADRLLDARPVAAQPVDLAGATAGAVADDYTDGWHGAGAYPGHSWAYDPRRQTWREQHQPPDEPAELRRQLAEREPALREWIRWFDTSGYLASNGLAVLHWPIGAHNRARQRG